ncbi:MAG: hypothetical protein E6K93_02545 [Thaumarchaeota archaeon]|nr:MAG: hypothetical protein E6K93_02545 [Nitrososphaerota archaeon]
MNRQATKLEDNVCQANETKTSMPNLSDGNIHNDMIKNGSELVSLLHVLLEINQVKYAGTMKGENRADFLTLTNGLILLTENLR